jgi:hypothetical protein
VERKRRRHKQDNYAEDGDMSPSFCVEVALLLEEENLEKVD